MSQDTGDLFSDATLYWELVGNLVYLRITQADISYVVNLVSQFMTQLRHLHLMVVQRIIRYILGTPNRGLFFPVGNTLFLTAYSDAD